MAAARYYKIRQLGTGNYLIIKSNGEYKWGSLSKARLFTHNALVSFLSRHYKEDTLPGDWEVVRFQLLENRSEEAENFFLRWTKKPPIKI